MFSSSSRTTIKIHGIEGMSPENIRDEVDRGARIVFFQYSISLVVVSMKRPSPAYLVKAGESRLWRGLPFILVSLLLGWWGFPWGPIYTIQALSNDLTGGIDVTDKILAGLAPRPPAGGTSQPGAAVPVAPVDENRVRRIVIGVAIVVALVVGIPTAICLARSQWMSVALVSGMKSPYSVELNGTSYRLAPGATLLLTLPEGDFVLRGAPGADPKTALKFDFSIPFFSHLTDRRVLVLNPDRTAVIYDEAVYYYHVSSRPQTPDKPEFSLRTNEFAYFLSAPNFFFQAAPPQASVPSGTTRVRKNHVNKLNPGSTAGQCSLLLEHGGYETMRTHLQRIAAVQPDDDSLLDSALSLLKPEDALALVETRLGDRPLRVDWHRCYQNLAQRLRPEVDLDGIYGSLCREDPNDGVRIYLLGRIDPAARSAQLTYERALAASRPCAYAYVGLGHLALQRGDYVEAVRLFRLAEQSGVTISSLSYYLRLARLGAGDAAALFKEAVTRLQTAPADMDAVVEAIKCAPMLKDGQAAAERIRTSYLAALAGNPATKPADRASLDAYLLPIMAYARGDVGAFEVACSKVDKPERQFQAAASRGDCAEAARLIEKNKGLKSGNNYLICYLLAKTRGDDAAAENCFAEAMNRIGRESRAGRLLASLTRATDQPPLQTVADLNLDFEEKGIVLAAMGLRYPEQREGFYALARKLNVDPAFPQLLINEVIRGGGGRQSK